MFFDEAADIDPEALEKVVKSMLADAQGKFFCLQSKVTLVGKDKDGWQEGDAVKSGWAPEVAVQLLRYHMLTAYLEDVVWP